MLFFPFYCFLLRDPCFNGFIHINKHGTNFREWKYLKQIQLPFTLNVVKILWFCHTPIKRKIRRNDILRIPLPWLTDGRRIYLKFGRRTTVSSSNLISTEILRSGIYQGTVEEIRLDWFVAALLDQRSNGWRLFKIGQARCQIPSFLGHGLSTHQVVDIHLTAWTLVRDRDTNLKNLQIHDTNKYKWYRFGNVLWLHTARKQEFSLEILFYDGYK